MNLKMSDLKKCLEGAGFTNVKTLLSSGNVAFDSSTKSDAAIERQIDTALLKDVGRSFLTIVRSVAELQALIDSDPYQDFKIVSDAKRVVTFARKLSEPKQRLPIEKDGARILIAREREAFSAYVPGPRGPVFMQLIETTFGRDVTTRTWETVKKCAKG
ncbi:MAG: hypothetical protein JWO95_982 [Verrucomicrobiales bacterium]|nr:hypothetical protein [Verrucomicrobiales bacterium]